VRDSSSSRYTALSLNCPYKKLTYFQKPTGCAIYRVERDREYWAAMYSGLSDFWWQHVVPGKHALAAGTDYEKYRPPETHALTHEMKKWSRRIAERAPKQIYGAEDMRG
jgi:uracil-DNA glycosylase